MNRIAITIAVVAAWTGQIAFATVWPQSVGPMEHASVFFDGSAVTLESLEPGPLPLLNHGESYTPPADVLDGQGYNNQYGFAIGSSFSLPAGSGVWVEVNDISSGLHTYEGGMRGTNVSMHTYAPILSSVGDRWMWNGSMNHPWYAAALPGSYAVTYDVYIGDETSGEPILAYTGDSVTFAFNYVPEPTSFALAVAGACALVSWRRRWTPCRR